MTEILPKPERKQAVPKNAKLVTPEQQEHFLALLEKHHGKVKAACDELGIHISTHSERCDLDPDFRQKSLFIQSKEKREYKQMTLYISQELLLEGLYKEWLKDEDMRDYRKIDLLTKRAAELNGNMKAGTEININNDNRSIDFIQPVFVKPDPKKFEVDTDKLRENMKAVELRANENNEYGDVLAAMEQTKDADE